jgi:excinuclease ABC subunit A
MRPPTSPTLIRLRGVRQNNLKGFDLDLPQNRLVVLTGRSGSGKSSLAFETLFAEGQRRYIETFSPYARQFFDRMDKPRVDSIEGIPPAIAIEQRNAVRSTRSTIGTLTEIGDYLKVLWPHLARLHCRGCGQPVTKDSPQAVWAVARRVWADAEVLITFDVPLSAKLSLAESLAFVAKQGYQRLLVGGQVVRLGDLENPDAQVSNPLTVVQDRLRLTPANRARCVEAGEQAYHFGKGRLRLHRADASAEPPLTLDFSQRLHCAACDLEYRDPTPALFSFNHPLGACPRCKGFGRIIEIDYRLAVPDRSKTLAEGAVKPWQSGVSAECQDDLRKFCRAREVPMDVPFAALSEEHQRWVLEGDPDYGSDDEHQWPRSWYGVKGYFRWLETKAYKMHVRVLLSRYRAYTPCPDCEGKRLRPEALLYRLALPAGPLRRLESAASGEGRIDSLTLADFYALPIREAWAVVNRLSQTRAKPVTGASPGGADPVALALGEVRARLGYLVEVGLGYLTLDRPTRTLSGGETERVNLTACLGSRLVNTLFVLDEPSVGLHPRDTDRLIRILERLRDAGNTVVVVEHEASVIRAADLIVDLGPGHGETGGEVVFRGPVGELLQDPHSLTGQYLSGRRAIELPRRRPVGQGRRAKVEGGRGKVEGGRGKGEGRRAKGEGGRGKGEGRRAKGEGGVGASGLSVPTLTLVGVTRHNLRDLRVAIPLERLVVVSGVSGSGKTTLIREVLFPALEARLKTERGTAGRAEAAAAADADAGETESDVGEEGPLAGSRPGLRSLEGWEALGRVILVDQSPLGRTPRSNPAVYSGAFDELRELFAASEAARQRGLDASAFSFNSRQGQCERCRGAGFEKIEMQFLSDVFIRCPDCQGRRYRAHVLECRVRGAGSGDRPTAPHRNDRSAAADAGWSIGEVLDATVDEALDWLGGFPESRPARRAAARLERLQAVGLGYLRLGQPINTLSGGESQRLKLAAHLAEAVGEEARTRPAERPVLKPTLFLFDEPTTGLHFEDVRILLVVFQRLVDAGHSVVVIEHNLEVIKCADWVLELGPDAGEEGGQLVVAGTPEAVAACPGSPTGEALRTLGLGCSPSPQTGM